MSLILPKFGLSWNISHLEIYILDIVKKKLQ